MHPAAPFLCALLLASPVHAQSLGCGTTTLTTGTHTLSDQGIDRPYRLHLPRNYDPDVPAPLILAFHGWGGTEDTLLDYRVVRREANRMGAIIAAPAGLGSNENRPNSWTALGTDTGLDGDGTAICNPAVLEDETYPSCAGTAQNICSWTHCQADDTQFVTALLDHLEAALCVDRGRVFATGTSNGGLFTWALGQDPALASRLTAIAPIIGLPHRGHATAPVADLPTLVITGTQDAIVPPGDWDDRSFTTSKDGEDFYYTSAAAITSAFATARGCDTSQPARPISISAKGLDCRSHCTAEDTALPPILDCRMDTDHDAKLRVTWPFVLQFFADHSQDTP